MPVRAPLVGASLLAIFRDAAIAKKAAQTALHECSRTTDQQNEWMRHTQKRSLPQPLLNHIKIPQHHLLCLRPTMVLIIQPQQLNNVIRHGGPAGDG